MTSLVAADPAVEIPRIGVADLGALTPVGRAGGQGRVYRPARALGAVPVVVKLYRHAPAPEAVDVLGDMIAFSHQLPDPSRARLHRLTAWPLAIVTDAHDAPAGIVMRDLTARFTVPFIMPSGRRSDVLLSLEHLLGDDGYLSARGLDVALGTVLRLRVAERVCQALAFLHANGIVVGDIAPNNLLVSFGHLGPPVTFIDCDSMVFRGARALPGVETIDWQLPGAWFEPAGTRAADAYKLGLIVLRLLARSHDAREVAPHRRHIPVELREPLTRALGPDRGLRPAPADWQRTLAALGATPGVDALYPGPPARVRAQPVARPRPITPPRPPAFQPRRPATGAGPRRSLTAMGLAWVLIGAVLLTLLLARLFAGAIPSSQEPQFGSGPGSGGNGPTYVYPGGGSGDFGQSGP